MIIIAPYDPVWPEKFKKEAKVWHSVLVGIPHQVHHVGSTSVPGLAAKPIIDILIEAEDLALLDVKCKEIEGLGYEIKGEYGIPGRRYFRKGKALRTHHVHAFQVGDKNITRHLAFRDYLIAHPDIAAAYGSLKQDIAERIGADRRAYQAAKSDFVQEQEALALEWYLG